MSSLDMAVLFILSAVAGTGIGGGGLFVVYLTAFAGYAQSAAQAVNLLSFLFAATVSTVIRMIRSSSNSNSSFSIPAVLYCAAAAIPGVYFGSILRQSLDDGVLRTVFGGILCAVGAVVLLRSFRKDC